MKQDLIESSIGKLTGLNDTMLFMKSAEVDEMIPATVLDIFMLSIESAINDLKKTRVSKS